MFSEFIKRILDNERESLSNRQEHTMPDVIAHKSSITKTDKYQSDIEALKQKTKRKTIVFLEFRFFIRVGFFLPLFYS